jgi:hypothetical protein
MESPQITPQGLQPISRRDTKILDTRRCIEDEEFSERRALYLFGEAFDALSVEEFLGAVVGEARNHARE